MNIPTLTESEIRELFAIFDLSDLQDLLPSEQAAPDDDADYGRAAQPENFGLEMLGQGDYAVICAHPTRSDQVIRVSRRDDGWIGYVASGTSNPLRPAVHALGWTGAVWVAISEALLPVPSDMEQETHDRLYAMMHGQLNSAETRNAQRLRDEVSAAGLTLDDMEMRNLMFRLNGDLVLNDPVCFMPDPMEEEMKLRFRVPEMEMSDEMSPF